jgi:hypothetical protein
MPLPVGRQFCRRQIACLLIAREKMSSRCPAWPRLIASITRSHARVAAGRMPSLGRLPDEPLGPLLDLRVGEPLHLAQE